MKKLWWPMVCAFFSLPFIGLFYVGKKCNDKKWMIYGTIYLVAFIAFSLLTQLFKEDLWLKILIAIYWICGLFQTHYACKDYQNQSN